MEDDNAQMASKSKRRRQNPDPQPTPQQLRKRRRRLSRKNMWSLLDGDLHPTPPSPPTDVTPDLASASAAPPLVYHLCTECRQPLTIMEDQFPTCTNPACAVMYIDILDPSPEWRYFNQGDGKHGNDPTRCGNPINELLLESSMGCRILCDKGTSYQMKRIRKWSEWQATSHKEKSLYEEFQFISLMAQNACIPKIFIDHAMVIHKDMAGQRMFRGMNRDGLKAASIYISCRLNGCPRTAHEIAEIFKLDKHSATYGCSTAVNILNSMERNLDPSLRTALMTTTASNFIERYCSHLDLPRDVSLLARFVTEQVERRGLVADNTPQALAAGITYFVAATICKQDVSKTMVKRVCGVSEVTINKCYKKLVAMKEKIVPGRFL
jgi:transcription initiation factor TFIIB